MTLEQPAEIGQNQGKDEKLLQQMDVQRKDYNLTWDTYCDHIDFSKETIFRWKRDKKISKAYRRTWSHFLDENEKILSGLLRSNLLKTRKRKSSGS